MGCWNGTCGISQLPILCGDNVTACLIAVPQNIRIGASGYCYITGFASPITMPFYGSYNDYGGIEDVKMNYNTKLICDKFSVYSFYDLIDQAERDELSVPIKILGSENTYDVGLWMAHDHIAKSFIDLKHWRHDIPIADIIRADAETFWAKAKKELIRTNELNNRRSKEELEKIGKLSIFDLRNKFIGVSKGVASRERYTNYFTSVVSGDGVDSYITGEFFDIYKEYIEKLLIEDVPFEDDRVKELLDDAVNMYTMKTAMDNLRKGFAPQSGKGSQSEEFDTYKVLNKSVDDYIKRAEEERRKFDQEMEEI